MRGDVAVRVVLRVGVQGFHRVLGERALAFCDGLKGATVMAVRQPGLRSNDIIGSGILARCALLSVGYLLGVRAVPVLGTVVYPKDHVCASGLGHKSVRSLTKSLSCPQPPSLNSEKGTAV